MLRRDCTTKMTRPSSSLPLSVSLTSTDSATASQRHITHSQCIAVPSFRAHPHLAIKEHGVPTREQNTPELALAAGWGANAKDAIAVSPDRTSYGDPPASGTKVVDAVRRIWINTRHASTECRERWNLWSPVEVMHPQ
ncbi:hypothetical protein BDN71DRAFT_1594275 [Pleurotus eryngii]|uniref:Uncharacterized protein n=1 Tax=Pleurotus eryngii TaxID=5323 RepID=A0A9P5ZL80_PLEER|nr:hypothetical protein BDN71DRAFT_1594275 [Pleurotus eryngii]